MAVAPTVKRVTIIPAAITPPKIGQKAFFRGRPNNQAAIEPVQAPVPGKGIATNINKAIKKNYLF